MSSHSTMTTIAAVNDDRCPEQQRMHKGIVQIPVCILGLYLDPHMHSGITDMRSPYAYGDQDQSPYAFGDHENPRMHTGIKINPRMHTGIACHVIPVCIRGSRCNPRMHTGIDLDPCMHTEICAIRLHTGIGWTLIPICIWGFAHPCMHTGIFQSLPVCTMKLCAYGKLSLVSPYANFLAIPAAHTGINIYLV